MLKVQYDRHRESAWLPGNRVDQALRARGDSGPGTTVYNDRGTAKDRGDGHVPST